MKPNHFRVVGFIGPDRHTIASVNIVGIDDISAEQYSEIGSSLLKLGKVLEPEQRVIVELNSLTDDGSKPFTVFQ